MTENDEAIAAQRREVDRLDSAIAELVAERVAAARRIARLKRDRGLAPRDLAREAELRERYGRWLPEVLAQDLVAALVKATLAE